MNSSEAVSDNLQVIKGIGPDTRKWLAETFEVRTFAALADLSGEEIVNRIKAENKPSVWTRWAKDWPKEAAIKAAEMEPNAEAQQSIPAVGRQNNDTPLAAASPEPSSPKLNSPVEEKDGWDILAWYVIEFQSRQVPEKPVERRTTVSYQGPGQETLPVPVERDRICDWIFEHFDGILPAKPETETQPDAEVKTSPQEAGPSTMSISQLRLFQPAGASSPLFSYSSERPQLRMVTADQPFDLEAILEESEPEASANGPTAFKVQFYVKNWDTNKRTNLGNVELEAIRDQLAFSALLPGISLARGKYRLDVLVLADPKPVVLGSIEIPLLSVW
jgi:hypothetical protein